MYEGYENIEDLFRVFGGFVWEENGRLLVYSVFRVRILRLYIYKIGDILVLKWFFFF